MTINLPDISQHLLIQSRTSHPRASGTEEHVGAWAQSLEKFWTLCFNATRSSPVVASDPRLESDCSSVDMTMTLHSGSHPSCIRYPPCDHLTPPAVHRASHLSSLPCLPGGRTGQHQGQASSLWLSSKTHGRLHPISSPTVSRHCAEIAQFVYFEPICVVLLRHTYNANYHLCNR